ncbi:GNAT family N-acetyltransferase [Teredinibacter sp. KSP-S5-2]|uniref:GNAT family N-acetyltransferase n=1 Tax=Teredinibacter sp. KSP-S5-2 TaxID=3034506 RepID=UPI0029352EEC|nr:GNAT family N-acetyltransferase [Teredinibacter sp. KSP-S5-2]WNO10046.1 GNAT family N-acetyltransferase [Teredinibacter sp. KSP-S5-2]
MNTIQYKEVSQSCAPMALLLLADPSEENIHSYLNDSWVFAATNGEEIIGVCVAKKITDALAEIYNVSVDPSNQKQGIGTKLLKFTLELLAQKGIIRVELGTGTFGYQLTYYQRAGFRVDSVIKNHFIENYSKPIYEDGIQLKDMLRLYIEF